MHGKIFPSRAGEAVQGPSSDPEYGIEMRRGEDFVIRQQFYVSVS